MKHICRMLTALLGAVLIGTMMMILVYMLPVDRMRNNLKSVIGYLMKEGIRPSWAAFEHKRSPKELSGVNLSERLSKLRPFTKADNFTDAIMFSKAIYEGINPIRDAMLNPSLKYEIGTKLSDPVANLNEILKDENPEQPQTTIYARYWHGYLVYMKPLLMIIGVSGMRMLNLLLQLIMFTLIVIKISQIIGGAYSLAFALSILIIDPISTVVNFQYAHVYYVILSSMIIMLYWNKTLKEKGTYNLLFMFSGVFTAYFDLLTYPFASLGMPAVLYLLINNEMKLAAKIKGLIFSGLSWGLGYAGMWSGKWLVSWLLTGYNTFADAFRAATVRTVSNIRGVSLHWILSNLIANKVFIAAVILILLIMVSVILVVCISVRKKKTSISEVLPLCLVSLYPFVWYAVLKQHSIEHHWMTHKLLCVSVFALSCVFIKCSGRTNTNKNG